MRTLFGELHSANGEQNGTAEILKCNMAHAIQLKWTFLAWFFCLKIVFNFSKKATPANSKQNLSIMQL